jgi:hypothetical protein
MTDNSDKPLLVDTGKGFSVKWKNRFLYSSRAPRESVLRRIETFQPQEYTLYLIPSPLLGYGLKELILKLPESSYILGVERFQELMSLAQPHLPAELWEGEKCRIIRTAHPQAACNFTAQWGFEKFKRCRRLDLTGGSRLDGEFYNTLEEELNRSIFSYWQTKASLVRMGPLWFRNIFRNIPIALQKQDFSTLNTTGPILLCGAGESLEESLPLIKKHREAIFLCAVDTAYPVLTGQGIIPDAVFNLDGQFYNFYDYYRHRGDSLYLISDITAYPASLNLPGVKPIFFSSHFADNRLLSRLKEDTLLPYSIAPLGSVGVTALSLCTLMSSGPIILTGLDFSYKPGKSHARDTVYHQIFLKNNCKTLPDGGMTELSLRRPSRITSGQLSGRRLRSDTVLEGYYHSFLELTSLNRDRCYQLTLDYPSLGVPLLNDEDFEKLLRNSQAPLVTLLKKEKEVSQIKMFLQKEIFLLENVISAWDIYVKENRKDSLDNALSLCDYLTLTSGTQDRESIYYTEAVKNARIYLSYAKNSLLSLS